MNLFLELTNWTGGILNSSETFSDEDIEVYMREMKKFWPLCEGDTIRVKKAD